LSGDWIAEYGPQLLESVCGHMFQHFDFSSLTRVVYYYNNGTPNGGYDELPAFHDGWQHSVRAGNSFYFWAYRALSVVTFDGVCDLVYEDGTTYDGNGSDGSE